MTNRLPNAEQNRTVSIEEIRKLMAHRLGSLMHQLKNKTRAVDELHELGALFESLPMASGEFGLATNRVRNALRYLHSDEVGAASYELRLLLANL